jgi:hypothetical protein
MRPAQRAIVLLAGALLLPACATPSAGSARGTLARPAHAHPASPSPPAATWNPSQPLGGLGRLGDPTRPRGPTVTVAARSSPPGAPITAVVRNGLGRTVYTHDSKNRDCAMRLAEVLRAGALPVLTKAGVAAIAAYGAGQAILAAAVTAVGGWALLCVAICALVFNGWLEKVVGDLGAVTVSPR